MFKEHCDAKFILIAFGLFFFAAWQANSGAQTWYALKDVCASLTVESGEAYDRCLDLGAK